VILFKEIITISGSTLASYPPNFWVIISRFICAIVLHMQLQDELKQGMGKMKFAINHAYKFKNFSIAFMAGFMQSSMIIAVEFINILSILSYTSTLDVIICFLGLAVIA
jgi:hypothetical protein